MSMEWYRMYHGMPFDTKLRVVAKRAGQPMGLVVAVWACMLDAASTHDPRGIALIDPEEIAVALDFDLDAIDAILSAMRDKQMLDENWHLTAWDKRQHTTSTERSKKSRAMKKGDAAECNAMQHRATRRSAETAKNNQIQIRLQIQMQTQKRIQIQKKKKIKKKIKKTEREKKRESPREKNSRSVENLRIKF